MNLLTIAALFSFAQTQNTTVVDKVQNHTEMIEQRVAEGKKYLEDHFTEGKEYFEDHMEDGKEYLEDNAEKGIENLDKIMDDVEDEVNHETHTGIGSTINKIYKSVKNKILSWFK